MIGWQTIAAVVLARPMNPHEISIPGTGEFADIPLLPTPQVAEGALLGPGMRGAKTNYMRCIADTGDVVLKHYRPTRNGVANMLETRPPTVADAAAARFVPGETVWGGMFKDHFGHMASEGVHRLWALALRPELADATVAFQVGVAFNGTVAPWFADMLALFGIAPAQILFVDSVVRCERLHVPQQGRTLCGVDLITGYLDIFPLVPPIATAEAASMYVYVSRLRHIHTGTYLGESLVQAILRDAGFDIVVPEETPLSVMQAKLRGAKVVIFAEGSAIHHLDLVGRISARALIIGRRDGTAYRFENVLRESCPDWRVLQFKSLPIGLDWNTSANTLNRSRACSLVDLGDLVAALVEFSGLDLPIPDHETASRAIKLDLVRFLMDPRTGGTSNDAQLGHAFRKLREVVAGYELFGSAA